MFGSLARVYLSIQPSALIKSSAVENKFSLLYDFYLTNRRASVRRPAARKHEILARYVGPSLISLHSKPDM